MDDKRTENSTRLLFETLINNNNFKKIEKIILYGSIARGNEKFSSDVDLLIITIEDENYKKFVTEIKQVIAKELYITEIDSEKYRKIDIHFCKAQNYKTSDLTYYKNVRKEGVIIYER